MTDRPAPRAAVGWDPAQYERFAQDRDRAAQDLIARLPDDLQPEHIWDLGCGSGGHAVQLARRYPGAVVHGVDSSADMLARARALDGGIDWRLADLRDWRPEQPAGLIFANASLHWVPDHPELFARLADGLAPGGVLAVQMPMAWETRHHTVLRDVAAHGPWAARLAAVEAIRPLLSPESYYGVLADRCAVDIWSTTWLHVLSGPDPVLEWLAGAGLRPYLAALAGDEAMTRAFLAALGARLNEAFPPAPDGSTLLPFPRLFVVARRAAA